MSVFRFSNIEQTDAITQSLSITDFHIKNTQYSYGHQLLDFKNIKSKNVCLIHLSNVNFLDLTFIRVGDLMKIQHQTNEQMEIDGLTIQNVTFGRIAVESYDLINTDVHTKLLMKNVNAKGNNANLASLIKANKGAIVQIENSTFAQNMNLMTGAVISAGYQNALITIYDSEFINNTALEGAVFTSESKSGIICHR